MSGARQHMFNWLRTRLEALAALKAQRKGERIGDVFDGGAT